LDIYALNRGSDVYETDCPNVEQARQIKALKIQTAVLMLMHRQNRTEGLGRQSSIFRLPDARCAPAIPRFVVAVRGNADKNMLR